MTSNQIVEEIIRLPLAEKKSLVEIILKEIDKETEEGQSIEAGVKALLDDYRNDEELTSFTSIDCDNFYENEMRFG